MGACLFMVRFNDLSTKQKGSKEDRFDVLAAEIEAAETGESSISEDVATLKTTVGKASGDGAGGLAKDMVDVKAAIGDADEPAEGTILARLAALENNG